MVLLAANVLGPLFLVIVIPVLIFSLTSGNKHDRNEAVQGIGMGCLVSLLSMGFMGYIAYKLFMIVSQR